MKNSDMPAMPLSGDAYTDFAHYDETKNTSYNPECQGLTKREHFVNPFLTFVRYTSDIGLLGSQMLQCLTCLQTMICHQPYRRQ